jgi:hypothetical protein
MTRLRTITHQFVKLIPDQLDEDTLYVSIEHATAVHRCLCGCGYEVVTPFSPTDWSLTFDGETVSLDPSIGNWSFDCQSHYWIERNRVVWSERWSPGRIAAGRVADARLKALQYADSADDPALELDVASGSHGLPAWFAEAIRRVLRRSSRGRKR